MADVVGVDLSGVERRLDHVTAATQRIEGQVLQANERIAAVSQELSEANKELQELKASFTRFLDENRKTVALQKAATELIRVRQEVEQNFGNYKVVRDTMLGVLQATDLALVKKTTISQVTEELMLSTPDYWLAPCLVAVSAWIGNDRDLANRAITEAVKRDEEKTALTMALICRRNNRTDTCYEWLSLYFAKQSAKHFTASNFTYLNAYLNGVFGPDKKHMCDDYVAKWMREAQTSGDHFEDEQVELWRKYCEDFTVDLEGQFPLLNNYVHEYRDISAYVSRINSIDKISGNFSRMQNIDVDQQQLKKDIDQTLVTLVSRYDEKEEPLRREERYLLAVRYFDGDSAAAKAAILKADRKKTEETIDLVAQMTNIIVKRENASPSEKKTAVSFLSSYIRGGFSKYITEKKPTFPQQITLNIEDWSGITTDGSNATTLKGEFERHMEQRRAEAIERVQVKTPKTLKIMAVVLAIFGVLGLFIALPLGCVALLGAVGCFFGANNAAKKIVENTVATNADFDQRILAGKQQIDDTLSEWSNVRELVQTFESSKPKDIVA